MWHVDVRVVVGVHPKGEVVRGDGPAPRGDHLRKDGLVVGVRRLVEDVEEASVEVLRL